MKIFKEKSGFTLIEMLVAMSIFIFFLGILINSYTSIIRSYSQSNEYREVYIEARNVFDTLIRELRDGMYFYGNTEVDDSLVLISKDAQYKTIIKHHDNDLILEKFNLITSENFIPETLNNKVHVTNFKYYITPSFDPYNSNNNSYYNQFQPMITIYMEIIKADKDSLIADQSFEFQTTITSRIYNQVYE